ncbi:MAG: 30S ribosomal protein S4 [Chloroflexi bacterium]|nr:30S ribosomal protein S4 [Chloroflexota bacterium]
MARNTDPVCKICKSQGEKLFLKGERCYTPKCAVDRSRDSSGRRGASGPPGGQRRRRRLSDHGIQLRAKQKARHIYGIYEKQFRGMFDEAARQEGVTGVNLLKLLERRLDNVIYRAGFATSRPQARQTVNHGHIQVNGRKVDIASFIVKPGDVVSWRETSKNSGLFKAANDNVGRRRQATNWITVDSENLTAAIDSAPNEDDVDTTIDTRLITEYYSRR